MSRMEWLSSGLVAMLLALVWPMTQAETERALSIGRAFDEERARFHKPYVLAVGNPTNEPLGLSLRNSRAVGDGVVILVYERAE